MYPGKGLFMSQEQQDATDYVRVTLTIHEFSEDGECCIVSDKHGHGTELSTDAFLHDAEDIDVGDTIACDILREAWEDTGLIPDDAGPHDVRACGRENIEVLVDLEVDRSEEYYALLRKNGMLSGSMTRQLHHMITRAYFTAVCETIVHDMPREEAMKYVDELAIFFHSGWSGLLRLE